MGDKDRGNTKFALNAFKLDPHFFAQVGIKGR